jgi:hypothetical protein
MSWFDYTVAISCTIKEEKSRRVDRPGHYRSNDVKVSRRLASDDYAGYRIKDRCLDGTDA